MIRQVVPMDASIRRGGTGTPSAWRARVSFHRAELSGARKSQFAINEDSDHAWISADKTGLLSTRILRQGLPFRVMASNNDGVWNETESAGVPATAAFHQTAWFMELAAWRQPDRDTAYRCGREC